MFEWSSPCSTIALAALSSFRSACPMFHRLTSVACPIFEWLLPREMRRARGQFAFPQFPHLYICFHRLHTCAQSSHCTPVVGQVPPIRMRTFTIAQSHNASFLSRPSLIILIILGFRHYQSNFGVTDFLPVFTRIWPLPWSPKYSTCLRGIIQPNI